jgi:predicted esterase
MNFEKGHQILIGRSVFHVMGEDDPYLNDERKAEMEYLCKQLAIVPVHISFKGGHEIDKTTLMAVLEA